MITRSRRKDLNADTGTTKNVATLVPAFFYFSKTTNLLPKLLK